MFRQWAEADAERAQQERLADLALQRRREVTVLGLGGPLCQIVVDRSTKVRDAKGLIERAAGIPPLEQRLLLGSEELAEWATFDLDAEPLTLTLVRRAPEAALWLARAEADIGSLRGAPPDLLGCSDFMAVALSIRHEALQFASHELLADRKTVMAFLGKDGRAFMFASPELRGDREVALAAVRRSGQALAHASEALRQDYAVVLEAVAQDGMALFHVPRALRAHKGIVLRAVQSSGLALMRADPALRDDYDVVRAAVLSDGMALEHASARLCGDLEIVQAAVLQNPEALRFAALELQADLDVAASSYRRL